MVILLKDQMRQFDRLCIEKYQIPGIILMENAARGIMRQIEQIIPDHQLRKFHIFCYKGNNGGDGFALARMLAEKEVTVRVLLWADPSELRNDALTNFMILQRIDSIEIEENSSADKIAVGKDDVIIDAMLGTGLNGPLDGSIAEWIDQMNQLQCHLKIAVDIPSGLLADGGQQRGVVFQADHTVTMAYLKPGMLLPPGRENCGQITVAPIGSARQALSEIQPFIFTNNDETLQLPLRPKYGYKTLFGRVGVIAGQSGMMGAGMLCSLAALKSGCGMVRWYAPIDATSSIPLQHPELMVQPVAQWANLLDLWEQYMQWPDIIALGPGLGTGEPQRNLILYVLQHWANPLVIDADGINNLDAAYLDKAVSKRIVLTPHPGEFAGLLGISVNRLQQAPLDYLGNFCKKYQIYVIFKMIPTLIGFPDGQIYINLNGNSGMATAGSGDVLTGIVAGLLAQSMSVASASRTAVFIHALSGDLAAERLGEYSLTATDLISHLADAFNQFKNRGKFG